METSRTVLDVPLGHEHRANRPLVAVGAVMAGDAALEQAVVPLRVEQATGVEARELELVVHVGGEHEAIPVAHEREQVVVGAPRRLHIAVAVDVAAPVGPVLLEAVEGMEAARVHVGEPVAVDEVAEPALEPLPGVGEARRGRQPRAGADHHRVALLERPGEPLDPIVPARALRRPHQSQRPVQHVSSCIRLGSGSSRSTTLGRPRAARKRARKGARVRFTVSAACGRGGRARPAARQGSSSGSTARHGSAPGPTAQARDGREAVRS